MNLRIFDDVFLDIIEIDSEISEYLVKYVDSRF